MLGMVNSTPISILLVFIINEYDLVKNVHVAGA